jgi:hypothetical protein
MRLVAMHPALFPIRPASRLRRTTSIPASGPPDGAAVPIGGRTSAAAVITQYRPRLVILVCRLHPVGVRDLSPG